MIEESEHDYAYEDLHHAFAAEVADLDIGVTPAGAVLTGGAALRVRRRLAAVSGVAALAVLPVAAVAIFASGGGNADNSAAATAGKSGTVGKSSSGNGTSAATTPGTPGGTTRPTTPKLLTPSGQVVLPPLSLGGNTAAPNPDDAIVVLGSGDFGGQHWRLVRDEFVIAWSKESPIASSLGTHLPMSQRGAAGTAVCFYVGLQWGDQAAGVRPDFNAGGQCGNQTGAITGPLALGEAYASTGPTPRPWVLIGQVEDASKVAKVSVTGPDGITAPQPVFPVPGERDGYYAVFLPAATAKPQQSLTITTYDAAGHVVGLSATN